MDDKEVSLFVTAFGSPSTPKRVSCSNSLEFDLTDSKLIVLQDLLSTDKNAIGNLSHLPLNASYKSRSISNSNKYAFTEKYHSI